MTVAPHDARGLNYFQLGRRSIQPVSYTHLDVYKRQGVDESALSELEAAPILGHGTVVGAVVAAF